MPKSVVVIAALAAVAAPSWALAQGKSNNTPASQNANGLPFTANDPPLSSFPGQGQGPPSLPQSFGGTFPLVAPFWQRIKTIVTGKTVTIKKRVPATPIVSRQAPSIFVTCKLEIAFIDKNGARFRSCR